MRAIKETGNEMLASFDKHDSVGIMDNYFPNAAFFTEFERFDRHVEKIKSKGNKIDYFTVCSPNYLHDAHIRFGLRYGADVICEKPLVLNPWNMDGLAEIEKQTGGKIYTILQLRLHPNVIALKKKVDAAPKDKYYEFDLTYITSRGSWYYASWKGDIEKSGGIATNIGVHFFDMLTWIFGDVLQNDVNIHTHDRAGGVLFFTKAKVRWFLSINADTLPEIVKAKGEKTFRSCNVDGVELEFSDGFTDLHTLSYQNILSGNGFDLNSSRKAIEIVHYIRTADCIGLIGSYHPLCDLPLTKHPFK